MTPRAMSTQPPTNQMERKSDAQPWTSVPFIQDHKTKPAATSAMRIKMQPSTNTKRTGRTLNDVTPSMAKFTIRRSGYFDSPAKRLARS